ncbi:MAG: hypothetical protein JWP13_148 [Candidatus Saccharibacteria bacterium]|nr:hypothetical protein [Candidatus Saccharibacteria bacterium]
MLQQVKAEYQKLVTIRSTYVILAICLALTAFISFYVIGYRQALPASSPRMIQDVITALLPNLVLLVSLVGILLVTHEYRYNTIMYTLTSSNSRLRVLLAKLLVVSCFTIIASLALAAIAALLTYAGAQTKGVEVVAQSIPYADLLWRFAFFSWGFAMFGLLFAYIIRSQVGTIIAFIVLPDILTGLLSLLLKENTVYVPFSALGEVLRPGQFTPAKAATVVGIYLVVGWAVAAYLFKKRDAN